MAIDPAIHRAITQYLMGQGGNPFIDEYDTSAYPYALGPEDEDEYNTLDYQRDVMNGIQDAADIGADPAFILSLGDSLGGYGPEAFEPVQVFQPIEIPGRMRLQQMLQSADPLDQAIAGFVQSNLGPGAILQEIETLMDDPDVGEDIRRSIPPTIVNGVVVNNQPNLDYVMQRVGDLETLMAQDDPRAMMWDGQTIDPETGLPALVTEEDSEATEALRRMGYTHTPYETFDPDMFAPGGPQQAEQERATMQEVAEATDTSANEMSKIETLLGKSNRTRQKLLDEGGHISRGRPMSAADTASMLRQYVEGLGGQNASTNTATWNGMKFWDSGPNSPEQKTADYGEEVMGRARQTMRDRGFRAQPNDRAAMLRTQLNQELSGLGEVRRRFQQSRPTKQQQALAAQARERAGNRQRYVEDLAARGIKPFALQNQARMGNIWSL